MTKRSWIAESERSELKAKLDTTKLTGTNNVFQILMLKSIP